MRSVSFLDGGLRDRDIIFRDETDLVFCLLGCAKLTAGGEGRVRILAIQCESFFSFAFPFPPFYHFFTIKRIHSHKQERCEDTRKGREETEISSPHSISGLQNDKCLTRSVHLVSNMI